MCRLSQSENMYVVNCCSLVETCEQKGIGLEHNATTLSNQPDGLDVSEMRAKSNWMLVIFRCVLASLKEGVRVSLCPKGGL